MVELPAAVRRLDFVPGGYPFPLLPDLKPKHFKGSPVQPFDHVLGISPEAGKGILLPCCAPRHFTSFSCPAVPMEHAVKPNS